MLIVDIFQHTYLYIDIYIITNSNNNKYYKHTKVSQKKQVVPNPKTYLCLYLKSVLL